MNAGQNSKYWRRWSAVSRANNWRMTKGRLSTEAVQAAGEHHEAVWRIAGNLADQNHRAVTDGNLRHACHVLACGRDISHDSLTNPQFDRLLLLWGNERDIKGLLIDPLNLASRIAWDHPDKARKDSLIRSIRQQASEPYIRSIIADIWGTEELEKLDVPALIGLNRKLKGNAPARPGDPY